MTTIDTKDLVGVAAIARHLQVAPNTVRVWRHRYEDFPEAVVVLDEKHHLYRLSDIWDWALLKWPHRMLSTEVYMHAFVIGPGGLETTNTVKMGPLCQAQGYLKAIKDTTYHGRWKMWTTPMGFVANIDATTHIYALDPTEEPEDWFVYEQRYKASKGER